MKKRPGLHREDAHSPDWGPIKPSLQVQRNTAKECGRSLTGITRHAVMEAVSFEGWHLMEEGERNAQRQEGVHASTQDLLSFPEP